MLPCFTAFFLCLYREKDGSTYKDGIEICEHLRVFGAPTLGTDCFCGTILMHQRICVYHPPESSASGAYSDEWKYRREKTKQVITDDSDLRIHCCPERLIQGEAWRLNL